MNKRSDQRLLNLGDRPVKIWFFSILSAAAGCSIIAVSDRGFEKAYLLIGFAHLIVLLPMMLYTRQRPLNIVVASGLSIAFPFWGGFVGLVTVGVGAPLACSVLWGLVLMVSLRRPSAFAIMVLVGLVSTVALFLPLDRSLDDDSFTNAQYVWYIAMLLAVPWMMSIEPVSPKPRFNGRNVCRFCGYSLVGLDPDAVCPECGEKQPEVQV